MTHAASSWQTCDLGEVVEINPRRPASLSGLNRKTRVSFVPMAAVSEIEGTISNPETRPISEVSKGFTYFAEGDVIFAKITPCMQNGKSAIARGLTSGLGFGSTEFHVLRPSASVTPEWVHFLVRQKAFRNAAALHFRGSAGQQRVPAAFLEKYRIPVPPIEQQRGIVARISECLLRVAEISQILEELRDHPSHIRGASVLEMLGLDNLRNWRDAYSHEGDFEWMTIEDICAMVSRGKHSKQGSSNTFLIKTRHVWPEGARDYSDCRLADTEDLRLRDELLVSQFDVLLACSARGSLGRSCYIATGPQRRVTVDTHVAILRANPKRVLPRFLFEFLNSPLGRYLLVSAEAGGRWHEEKIGFRFAELNLQDLKQIRVPVPTLGHQEEIVAKLSQLDALMEPMVADFSKMPVICEATGEAVIRQAFAGEL
jgi:type I restriction enzyme S subunit